MIRFENASVTYPGGVHALKNLTLEIPDGQMMVIVGLSGAGKSTLIRAINGLVPLSDGDVTIDGQSVRHAKPRQLREIRSKIGMIFQTFNLLPTLTALENVALPLRLQGISRGQAEKRARTMLTRVGLGDRLTHRPDELSGGERQRVAIARALIFAPPVLLADEPTGNLDSATGKEILDLLDDLHREFDTTIVLVTHNEEAAQHCDRILRLRDWQLVNQERVSKNTVEVA
jgi:putative ABC transport system ATP-binding protein